jgi:hypothetical protein
MLPDLASMGNDLDKNWNHLNWTGAIMKPYPMNRVNLSKSNGGGRNLVSGMSSWEFAGFFLSNSWISIAIVSSFVSPPGFRSAASRMAVIDCATVSAIPPKTALVIIIVSTAGPSERLLTTDHGVLLTWSLGIVGVEFRDYPCNDRHLDEEDNCMYQRLVCAS